MKFAALLSGGKDSCYNIMKCVQHGHELMCLANLCPPPEFLGEDMDSFMYQTAGHQVLGAFSECLGVPLVRRAIRGRPVSQHLNYAVTTDDEVEDLFLLLKDVTVMFPEVKAVSCGAILSNYQRFRVENVCMRLGLIPLHYLWQRDRDSLLGEMIDCGLHAILLKVSGGGLEPNRHIGRDLATLRPAFEKLRDRFGLDICGEGGEYESLVLDCPLFYRRINLTKTRLVVDGGDPSVGHLAVDAFETVPKERSEWPLQRPFPLPTAILSITNLVSQADVYLPSVAAEITVGLDGLAATNLLMPPAASLPPVGENRAVVCQQQLHALFIELQRLVTDVGASLPDVCYVHLYIADIDLFPHANAEYTSWFGINPPSRSCIAIPLPAGVLVAMDAMLLVGSHTPIGLGKSARRGVLHVQSISEWAPMSIGPYSQATVLGNSIVFAAGQIALQPELMSLLQCPDVSSSCIFATELIELVSHYEEDSAPRIPRFCRPTSNEATPVNVRALSLADAVSFLPLPLFCELVLSMRNAAEVLSSLHCDLRRRSALCIVYVCTNQLSALLGEKDRCKCLGDIRLATKRLVACGVQDLWESMYSLLSNRNRDSSKECRPSDDKEDSIDEEYIDTPVVVIEVTGLPRAAAVEVEFVGIGESCRQSPYRSTNRSRNWLSSDVVLLACRNTSIQMHPCWPLLQAAQGPAVHGLYVDWLRGLESLPTVSHSSLAAASVQVTSVGDLLIATNLSCISFDSDIECQEQWVGSEEAFCFGAVTVQVLSSENLQKLLKHVFVMLLSINRMVWEGKVKLEALRCVKFFIPSAFTVISGFIESIPRISQVVLGPVPVTPVLTADNDCCMMSATFIALDLQQLKTDIWMRGD